MARLVVIEDYDSGNGRGPHVHTFRQSAIGLLGAHWGIEQAKEAMEKYGVEEAGEAAKAMGHGIVLIDETGPLFFESRDANKGEQE